MFTSFLLFITASFSSSLFLINFFKQVPSSTSLTFLIYTYSSILKNGKDSTWDGRGQGGFLAKISKLFSMWIGR